MPFNFTWGLLAFAKNSPTIGRAMVSNAIACSLFLSMPAASYAAAKQVAQPPVNVSSSSLLETERASSSAKSSLPMHLKQDDDSDLDSASTKSWIIVALLAGVLFFVLVFNAKRSGVQKSSIRKISPLWLSWFKKNEDQESIQLIANKQLDSTARLYVVEWQGHHYFLASNGQVVTILDKLSSAEITINAKNVLGNRNKLGSAPEEVVR